MNKQQMSREIFEKPSESCRLVAQNHFQKLNNSFNNLALWSQYIMNRGRAKKLAQVNDQVKIKIKTFLPLSLMGYCCHATSRVMWTPEFVTAITREQNNVGF